MHEVGVDGGARWRRQAFEDSLTYYGSMFPVLMFFDEFLDLECSVEGIDATCREFMGEMSRSIHEVVEGEGGECPVDTIGDSLVDDL